MFDKTFRAEVSNSLFKGKKNNDIEVLSRRVMIGEGLKTKDKVKMKNQVQIIM